LFVVRNEAKKPQNEGCVSRPVPRSETAKLITRIFGGIRKEGVFAKVARIVRFSSTADTAPRALTTAKTTNKQMAL